jgi:crotonobetainyl-CoA:carnitine CoA-transferase CaiB-like acyl-CoA transferase
MFYIAAGAKVMTSSARAWTKWWAEEGIGVKHLEEFGWPVIDFAILAPDDFQRIQNTMADFMKKYTKAELYDQALKRNLPLVPVSEPGELIENAQLKHREFWIDLDHPDQGLTLTYPGPWAKSDLMPLTAWRPAPTIGEHNKDIYGRVLGLTRENLDQLKQAGVI